VTRDYAWRTGREAILAFGQPGQPTVLLLPPLFEEGNRTRALLVAAMRMLAVHGIASALPDLPGTNESPVPTLDVRFDDWCDAVAALAGGPDLACTAAFRGGALLDGYAPGLPHWRMSPETGARVVRDMARATALTSGTKAGVLEALARSEPTMLAGSTLHPTLVSALADTMPADDDRVRTVRLEGDALPADAYLPGKPLWRAAEPGRDDVLAQAIADDIADWIDACGAR